MNDEPLHPYIEPELEARIVALVLGESSDFEREELERLIEERPELKLFHDRIESTDQLLREIAVGESSDEWKLSGDRRAALLNNFGESPSSSAEAKPEVENIARPRFFRLGKLSLSSIAAVAIFAALGLVVASLFMPAGIHFKRGEYAQVETAKDIDDISYFEEPSAPTTGGAATVAQEKMERSAESFEITLEDERLAELRKYAGNQSGLERKPDGVHPAGGNPALDFAEELIEEDRDEDPKLYAKRDSSYAYIGREDAETPPRGTLETPNPSESSSLARNEATSSKSGDIDVRAGRNIALPAANAPAPGKGKPDVFASTIDASGSGSGGTVSVGGGMISKDSAPEVPSAPPVDYGRQMNRSEFNDDGGRFQFTMGAPFGDEAKSPSPGQDRLTFPDATVAENRDQVLTRHFLGGANSLHGFDYRDVGPRDENGGASESNANSIVTAQTREPDSSLFPSDSSDGNESASSAVVGQVQIEGNEKTKDKVIRREVPLIIGNVASIEPLQSELRELKELARDPDTDEDTRNRASKFIREMEERSQNPPNSNQWGSFTAGKELANVEDKAPHLGDLPKVGRLFEKTSPTAERKMEAEKADGIPKIARNYVVRLQERVKKSDEAALRGSQLMADGDYQGAIDQYRTSMDLLPDAPIAEPRRRAYEKQFTRAGVRQARERAEEGRYPEALAMVEEVLQPSVDPDNIDAKRLLEQLNDPDYYSPALTSENLERVRRVKLALKAAQAYTDLGDFDRADREYHKALNEDPYNEAARRGQEETERFRINYYDAAYDHTRAKMLREVAKGWESPVPEELESTEPSPPPNVGEKLKSIVLPSVEFQETPLKDALEFLQQRSVELDPEPDISAKGVNIVISRDRLDDTVEDTPITLRLTNVPLGEALHYTTALARQKYEVEPYAVVVEPFTAANDTEKHPAAKSAEIIPKISLEKIVPVKAPPSLDETKTSDEPFSTFSLHVSDVSFKLAQAALAKGEWPDKNAIRIEEFVNAFDYGDPKPTMEEKVACQLEQAAHPFLQQRNILRVSMRTAAQGRNASTPLRLTFLLDNSGSMERADRRETVRRAFALLVSQLQPSDQVTLISFARTPRLLADKVGGDQGQKLLDTIAGIPSEGGTNLEAALSLAFEKAREQKTESAQNRIVLLTDGAANLGNAKPEDLSKIVETMRNAGVAFDAAGIGTEGLNDEILEALTRKGDGRYYLLDRPEDADAGFAKQIAGALRPAAGNVKVQVEFNPDRVSTYKLLGFEKHRLNKEDFRNDAVDAAELAAEEAGVALYQFQADPEGTGDIGFVSVRFRDMASGQMVERRWPIAYDPGAPLADQASPTVRLAASAAFLAARLKEEPLGEIVELDELQRLVADLPARLTEQPHVAQIRQMIESARQISAR